MKIAFYGTKQEFEYFREELVKPPLDREAVICSHFNDEECCAHDSCYVCIDSFLVYEGDDKA